MNKLYTIASATFTNTIYCLSGLGSVLLSILKYLFLPIAFLVNYGSIKLDCREVFSLFGEERPIREGVQITLLLWPIAMTILFFTSWLAFIQPDRLNAKLGSAVYKQTCLIQTNNEKMCERIQ